MGVFKRSKYFLSMLSFVFKVLYICLICWCFGEVINGWCCYFGVMTWGFEKVWISCCFVSLTLNSTPYLRVFFFIDLSIRGISCQYIRQAFMLIPIFFCLQTLSTLARLCNLLHHTRSFLDLHSKLKFFVAMTQNYIAIYILQA
jgi:hypothetical protein